MRTLPFKRTISAIQGKAALGLLAWAALLSGVALLPQSAPQAQTSPAPPQFCYPAGSQQCYDAQSKAEAALRAQPLPGGRVVAWRRTDGVQIASVYGRRQFIYAIPRESAEQLYAPSYWRIRSDSLASIAPGCTPSPDPNMPGTCADEGETVAKMMEAYRNARPNCAYTPPVVVSERPGGYRTVTYSATNPPYHGLVNYDKRIYRTTRSCPAGVAQLEFHIGKQASFTCHAGSQGLQDSSAYGDGKNDIELPALCQNDTKRAIDGPMLQVASCPANGNPCYPATGDKARFETDFEFAGRSFTRIYHSLNQLSAGQGMAPGWTHSLAIRLEGATSSSPTLVSAQGYYETFVAIGSDRYRAENSQDRVLERVTGAFPVFWRLRDGSGEVQEFDSLGRVIAWRRPDEPLRDLTFAYINLQSSSQGALAAAGWLGSVTDAQGRQLRFEYGQNGLLSRIVQPDGSAVSYGYDAFDNLVSADYGAGRIKRYHYAEAGLIGDASQRHHLTGITAESGLRYASFRYDAQGRAIESRVLGTPNEVTTVAYDSDTRSTVTTADNLQRVYTLQPGLYRRITGASEAGSDTAQQYDASGRVVQRTDKRGVITQYEYTAGYRSAVIEAVGTPQQRREETDRDPATQRVLEMRTKDASGALVARSRYAYNARGQLTSTTAYDPANGVTRTATLSYCESTEVTAGSCPFVGLVKAIDGPRTDVSDVATFAYRQADHPDCATAPSACAWRKGDLWKTTNAAGHVTEVLAYDGAGRVTSMRDQNGIITTLQYDPRGWLTRRTVLGDSAILFGDAVTRIDYTADGLIRKLTRPDGSFALFGYDAGQRMTTVADSDGNAVVYTLNAAGERIAERTYDATGGLTRELSRAFDSLGRLVRIVDANNAATVFAYDQEGNLTGSTDPLLRASGSAYDALGRMTASLGNANAPVGAGDRAQILYVYDALDRLTRVTDPKGLHTDYAYNGFGERTRLSSPDTGVSTYGYDAAGNQVTTTDARGVTKNVSYDALDRPTAVAYPSDGTQNVGFAYDTASGDCAAGETYLTGRLAHDRRQRQHQLVLRPLRPAHPEAAAHRQPRLCTALPVGAVVERAGWSADRPPARPRQVLRLALSGRGPGAGESGRRRACVPAQRGHRRWAYAAVAGACALPPLRCACGLGVGQWAGPPAHGGQELQPRHHPDRHPIRYPIHRQSDQPEPGLSVRCGGQSDRPARRPSERAGVAHLRLRRAGPSDCSAQRRQRPVAADLCLRRHRQSRIENRWCGRHQLWLRKRQPPSRCGRWPAARLRRGGQYGLHRQRRRKWRCRRRRRRVRAARSRPSRPRRTDAGRTRSGGHVRRRQLRRHCDR